VGDEVKRCEVCGREKVVRGQGFQEDRCWRGFLEQDDRKCYRIGYERSQAALAAARRECEAMYRALKMVDDAYWGEFCGCCGVILSLESQDEECGPQHTAVQLAHECVEAREALAAPAAGGEGKR
jgi:hypothetical protein